MRAALGIDRPQETFAARYCPAGRSPYREALAALAGIIETFGG